MLSIGIVVGLLGYGLTYWGAQLWSGCTQNSFLDIMWPGGQRFTPCAPQSGGGASGSGGLTGVPSTAGPGPATGPATLAHPAPGHGG